MTLEVTFLIAQNNNGDWLATCELCQWHKSLPKRNNAENKLRNHINIVHKKGVKNIKYKKRPAVRENILPQTPASIRRF